LRDSRGVNSPVADLLARADAASVLPKLGGMARPNGVVIVSERFWAFATTSGELHEGAMPLRRSRASRIPLVRGLLQLAASMAPLVRGRGVARLRERLFLLAALLLPFAFVALPGRLELAAGILTTAAIILWLFRGRTLRLHGAEHRAIAAVEAGSLAATWAREAGVSKLELHVFPWNEPAIALYEQFGFEREGLRKAHYRRGDEYVDAILMALRL